MTDRVSAADARARLIALGVIAPEPEPARDAQAPDRLPGRVYGLLRASRHPSTLDRLARRFDVPPDVIEAALANLISEGMAEAVEDNFGRTAYVTVRKTVARQELSEGQRIASGLGSARFPLPMGPSVSDRRAQVGVS